ncbi:unnamed protein product [Scytosiphon promiscuus]
MGAEPAPMRRKHSLSPLQPVPRAPVATFGGEPQPVEQGRSHTGIPGNHSLPAAEERDVTFSSVGGSGSGSADAIAATLAGVADSVKNAIKAYEQTTSLPYDRVPPEVCRARDGTRSIDLSAWSLLVDDIALKCIAASDRDRIFELARQSSVGKVGSHIDAMGLTAAFKGVDKSGMARFDASSMVAWREKQTLERMKLEEQERAQEYFTEKEGLTSLDIAGAQSVGDRGIAALSAQCRRLQSLDISGANRVTDVAIRSLAVNCTGLTRLSLAGCLGICGPGLAAVGECCPRLVHLDLSDCKQASATGNPEPGIGQWVLTRLFRGCHDVEVLSLARCSRVGDEELKELGVGCRGLVRLDLTDCNQVSDTGMLEVARRCSSLTVLELSRSDLPFKVGDVTLMALGEGCPGLQRLNVKGCDTMTDVGLAWMSAGCPALEHLDVSGCVSNAGVTSLCENCPLLAHLEMASLKHVTDIGVSRLSAGCTRLMHLGMSGFVNLSDGMQRDFALTGIQALAKGCTELQTLVLDRCFQVSKTALRAIGGGLHSLRRLSLAQCPSLTLEGMASVAQGCPSLTDLNLPNCGSAVTDAVVTAFARGCRGLRKICLRGVVGVPPPLGAPGILAICSHCRELEVLDLGDVSGLEDSAMVGFNDHEMDKLEKVNLMDCPKITGAGVQWLVAGCPALTSLNVKGTKATLTALNIVKERYPYSRIKVADKFFGLSPLPKMRERIVIKEYASLQAGARMIQGCYRQEKMMKVQARRLRRQEEKAACMVTRILRRKQGRAKLQALRLVKNRESGAAIVIQKLWRKALARMLAVRRRREREMRERIRRANTIQRRYRGVLGRRKAIRRGVEVAKRRKKELAAVRMFQQRFRIHHAKVTCARLREQADRLRRKRDESSRVLQRRWRSYCARRELEKLKRLLRLEKARKQAASIRIQNFARVSRCRKVLERKRRQRARRHASATIIQRHYRGVVSRVQYVVLCEKRQVEREKDAALRLQCWQRLAASKALLGVLAVNRSLRDVRERDSAKRIQQAYRRYKIRIEAQTRKKNHEDEVRAMSRLEDWAATRIQISGEIRWRRPQDFLELLPRPPCGDCGLFEAFSECADCGEFFCSACNRKVHGGGKRLHHEFRALYDFYGKRVDYGEGEFPSCWPTDMAQARR